MTQVRVKDTCPTCKGTGKNDVTIKEATAQAKSIPTSNGVVTNGIPEPVVTLKDHIKRIRECSRCKGVGAIERWDYFENVYEKYLREQILQEEDLH